MNAPNQNITQLQQALDRANRNLTVEAALERVRARALGMQASDELSEVSQTLFEQFESLGFPLSRSAIAIVDEATGTVEFWPHMKDYTGPEVLRLSAEELENGSSPRMQKDLEAMREAREQGEPHYIFELVGAEEIIEYNRDMKELFNFSDEWFEAAMNERAERRIYNRVFFSRGFLNLRSEDRLSDPDLGVAKRFADVFDFAYDRFLELREKEEQVLAAERRAAVDRVRAEAMAMSETGDIADLIKALWEGLKGQGLDFNNLLFQVADREVGVLQIYHLAAEDRGIPSNFLFRQGLVEGRDLYRTTVPISLNTVQEFVLSGEASEIGKVTPEYAARYFQVIWGMEPELRLDTDLDRLSVPFADGGIRVIAPPNVSFTQADISLVEEFSGAVSLGFQRYFDFQRLEVQNRALEAANEQIQESNRLKSQFLATMSHELRTPLNAIIGFTRLVMRRSKDDLPERQLGNLEKVLISADHLLNLINEILDLSRIESGRTEVTISTFEVQPLVENCTTTVGSALGKDGVELTCEVGENVGQATTDEPRLRQVIINLLSNALKFTHEGSVRVHVDRADDELIIAVSDTGIGISEEDQEHIFDEFRQVDGTSTREYQGTGLGLAITKKLTELLGGTIGVESVEGEGSTFTARLPVVYGEARSSARPAVQIPARSTDERVLVVIDDDPNVAVILREELHDEGYRVASALTADEGVALVKKLQPIAVTVDIIMPGKDGWETIAMLQADRDPQNVPIIVVSASDNRELGFRMGALDYLVKPVDRNALVTTLQRIDVSSTRDILVVDDDPTTVSLMIDMLDLSGFHARAASNGQEALAAIEQTIPDAIFLDLMMPIMDGFQVVEKLQENEDWKQIPVVVVTAKDLSKAEQEFLQARVSRVVEKGRVDPTELGDELREMLRRYERE